MIRLLAVALLAFAAFASADPDADPTTNPYLATVVGTSFELKALVPTNIPLKVRRLPRYEGRVIPDVLRYGAQLDYSYAKQNGPAPLIFVIAGTGAAHDSELTQFLMHAFYQRGISRRGHHVADVSDVHHRRVVDHGARGTAARRARRLHRDAEDLGRDRTRSCR